MNYRYIFLLFFIGNCLKCVSQLQFSEQTIDLGAVKEAYEIKGFLVLKNPTGKKIFLMRADADKGVKVYTSKKTLLPADTSLLIISFIPESAGKFKKKINLISSDKATPYEIDLSGNLATLRTDDKTACYYFGSRPGKPIAVSSQPLIVPENTEPHKNEQTGPGTGTVKPKPSPAPSSVPKPVIAKNTGTFSEADYRPNNILFLVDVSSSMRDSLKLPLMKKALHTLIDAARSIDTISFVTYASKVIVIKEAVSGSDKSVLHAAVDSLKAKGMTSGNRAILFSQQMAQKHFIAGGNNQVILATDGEFKFIPEDQVLWKERQLNKKIILSTVAFGKDKDAIKNLKDIASKGNGSFIHIEKREGSNEQLLNEIRMRSRK